MESGDSSRDSTVEELCSVLLQVASALRLQTPSAGEEDMLGPAVHTAQSLLDEILALRAAQERSEQRLGDILAMISSLVSFDFTRRAQVSETGDKLDALAMSLNMMAEELAVRSVSKEYVDNIIQSMSDLLIVMDPTGLIKSVNAAVCRLSEYQAPELEGEAVSRILPETVLQDFIEHGNLVLEETTFKKKTGNLISVSLSVSLIGNKLGEVQGFVCVARDLTERKRLEEEQQQRLRQLVESQALLLEELSTPLIPITDEILVMPVIGTVDDRRAAQIMETLLDGIVTRQARLVVIDITGVGKIDERAVQGLLRAVKGVKLLGAQVILTGIRPGVAVALLELNMELGDLVTFGSLQSGIIHAMQRLQASSVPRAQRRRTTYEPPRSP